MIVYKDMISGDEVLSDAFSLKEVLDKEGNPVSQHNTASMHIDLRMIFWFCVTSPCIGPSTIWLLTTCLYMFVCKHITYAHDMFICRSMAS